MKFKEGDTVRLSKHGECPAPSGLWGCYISWSVQREALVGIQVVLQSKNTDTGFWLIRFSGTLYSWPEEAMVLVNDTDDEPTMPGVKRIPVEKEQWLVSRSLCVNANECSVCRAPLPCEFHSPTQRSPSFGEGFAKAAAIRAQFPKP